MSVILAILLFMAYADSAEAPLSTVRDLYRAAAYDDALVLLNGLHGNPQHPDEERAIEQYRALCLLALGRVPEAERAIESVVTIAPSYHLPADEASPRVRSLFGAVRRRVLPDIIQQKYADAKAAFDRKDSASASTGFTQVLDLLADPDVASAASQPPLSSLRPLAVDFRNLSEVAAAPPPIPSHPAVPSPSRAAAPPRSTMSSPARAIERRIYGPEDANVVPPVILRQVLPPVGEVFAVRQGMVEIIIDETGSVEAATTRVAVNPVYDRLVLSAAKNWRYRAATLDGTPVRFRKIVQIDLKPR